jgi:5'-nucleotidase
MKTRLVAETTDAIEGDRTVCRAVECPMGSLIADAMLDRVRDQGIQIAIQNGGGIRASIDAGEVTMGEVLSVLPFQNTLSTFEVTGADIVAALENGVGQIEEGAGRFPQVAGMSFVVDSAAPAGERVSDVMVGDAPIDPDAVYGVVSNNYVRNGGDGYSMFEDAANAYDYGPDLADVLAEYMAANGPVAPYTDGRITVN